MPSLPFLTHCIAYSRLAKLIFRGDCYFVGYFEDGRTKHRAVIPPLAVLEAGATEVDLSNKSLGPGAAAILAAWISNKDWGALTRLNVSNNLLSKRRNPDWSHTHTHLRDVWIYKHVSSGRVQVAEPADFYLPDLSGVLALAEGIKSCWALSAITFGDRWCQGLRDSTISLDSSMAVADLSHKNLGPSGGAYIAAAFLGKCW